ncbi:hypothetical protein Hypma_007744 [Hypsizygus marmoreus]|uniref:Uncharacterized protein n=1 Tax=Hypsizygus marmoreus TaxID=39966 RepID=A0A369JTM0_HYPMA|nr:hypothetical protein Hypma_007744 [Hypsizygus marmoreus]
MNVSTLVFDFSFQISQVSPSTLPGMLWNHYVEYLWNYHPNSWVARIASISRFLALLVSFPIIVLGLLDITSYGIARTLGVIDDVKASTSDIATVHQGASTPSILIESSTPQSPSVSSTPFSDSEREALGHHHHHHHHHHHNQHNQQHTNLQPLPEEQRDTLSRIGVSQPHTFYASEDNNLKLSGVGVFSPAASRPASPVLSRRNLQPEEGRGTGQETDEGLRQRVRQGDDDGPVLE